MIISNSSKFISESSDVSSIIFFILFSTIADLSVVTGLMFIVLEDSSIVSCLVAIFENVVLTSLLVRMSMPPGKNFILYNLGSSLSRILILHLP